MPTTALTISEVTNRKNNAYFNALKAVPLGNSKFQIQKFTLSHLSPERNYRQAILQMRQDIRALVNAQGHKRKEEVRIRRLNKIIKKQEAIIANKASTEDEKFEAQCVFDESLADIEVSTFEMQDQEVLEEDSMHRIAAILEVFNDLPNMTRDKFEKSEQKYWSDRFIEDATSQLTSTQTVNAGLIAAMKQIGMDPIKTLGLAGNPRMIKENNQKLKLLESAE